MNASVVVVDDSALARKMVGDTLDGLDGVKVVGRASNGKIALDQIRNYRPDIVTLDLEMPEMDGVQVLENLKSASHRPSVVIVTSQTTRMPELLRRALALGAVDVVAKPSGPNRDITDFRSSLSQLVLGLSQPGQRSADTVVPVARCSRSWRASAVCIGISTGGPTALASMIPKLPASLGVPVFIVQHMPPGFTEGLVKGLDEASALKVVEGAANMPVKAGQVYVAPGGSHMGVERTASGLGIYLSDAAYENHCRPAADFLFRSAQKVYDGNVLGVIMTGMGNDGAAGLSALRAAGAYVLGQDADSCTVYGMPKAALEAGAVDEVVPLSRLAHVISKKVRNS